MKSIIIVNEKSRETHVTMQVMMECSIRDILIDKNSLLFGDAITN